MSFWPKNNNKGEEEKVEGQKKKVYNMLTPEEARIILFKGTEWPGTGDLLDNKTKGTYICR